MRHDSTRDQDGDDLAFTSRLQTIVGEPDYSDSYANRFNDPPTNIEVPTERPTDDCTCGHPDSDHEVEDDNYYCFGCMGLREIDIYRWQRRHHRFNRAFEYLEETR